jgi:hypothetical protein
MTKKLYFLVFGIMLSLYLPTASCQTKTVKLDQLKVKRELLKEYFLCSCIIEGFNAQHLEDYDISQAVYFEIAGYDPEAFGIVKIYAKSFIQSIEPSIIEDLGYKKAIIMQSIKKSKSKEVDKLIKSLDKYMLSD